MDEQEPTVRDLVRLGQEIADLMARAGKENFSDGIRIVVREIFRELQKRDSGIQSCDLICISHAITDCILEAMREERRKADEADLERIKNELEIKG